MPPKRRRDVLGWIDNGTPIAGRSQPPVSTQPLTKRSRPQSYVTPKLQSQATLAKQRAIENKHNASTLEAQWDSLVSFCNETDQWKQFFTLLFESVGEEELKETFFPGQSKTHYTDDERHQILFATEDITDKDLLKICSIPGVSFYIPHPNVIRRWRKHYSQSIWELGTTKTLYGVYVPALYWCQLIYLQQYPVLQQEATTISLCWTVDYAKNDFGWLAIGIHRYKPTFFKELSY
jgi:hypothetical protein